MADYLRIRTSTGEFCYGYEAFKRLSVAAICRRYGLGDEWVDRERDEAAVARQEEEVV